MRKKGWNCRNACNLNLLLVTTIIGDLSFKAHWFHLLAFKVMTIVIVSPIQKAWYWALSSNSGDILSRMEKLDYGRGVDSCVHSLSICLADRFMILILWLQFFCRKGGTSKSLTKLAVPPLKNPQSEGSSSKHKLSGDMSVSGKVHDVFNLFFDSQDSTPESKCTLPIFKLTADGRNPNNHWGCKKPCSQWDRPPINLWISSINSMTLLRSWRPRSVQIDNNHYVTWRTWQIVVFLRQIWDVSNFIQNGSNNNHSLLIPRSGFYVSDINTESSAWGNCSDPEKLRRKQTNSCSTYPTYPGIFGLNNPHFAEK